jgi:hypothetical protein
MTELPGSSEDHSNVVLVGGLDHFLIADRPAGLNDRGYSGARRLLDAVAEGKERIGAHYGALGVVPRLLGLVHREKCRIDARHLAGTDADGRAVADEHDGVGLHASNGPPGELKILSFLVGRVALCHDAPLLAPAVACGTLLGEETSAHALVVECVRLPLRCSL